MIGSPMTMADRALGAGVKREAWPAWQRFKLLYLSDDGRVVDASTEAQVTTSQAQSYASFFALLANDREAFDLILRWTHENLSAGKLDQVLPACRWGRANDGTWRVLDSNAATHADLWMAYTLGEAARLWNEMRYATLGGEIARNILRQELALIPTLGPVLMPAPHGFISEHGWRLNPSRLPLSLIRGLARQTKERVWHEIERSSERAILGATPKGFAADWIEYTRDGFVTDRRSRGVGGYDAIHVYLWAGMLPASEPSRDKLVDALGPMLDSVSERGTPPEIIDTQTLEMRGEGSPGFSAALLPMLANARMTAALQIQRLRAAEGSLQDNQSYCSDALALFGLGWLEQRYRFNRAGLLSVRWTPASHRPH